MKRKRVLVSAGCLAGAAVALVLLFNPFAPPAALGPGDGNAGAPPGGSEPGPPPAIPTPDDGGEADVQALAGPDGRVEDLVLPGERDLVIGSSPPMDRLAARGGAVQPRLIAALRDPARRDAAALVLGRVGDRDALPHLIDLLPADAPGREGRFSRECVLTALARLTGRSVGLDHRFVPDDPPDVRADWRAWYAANRDYLYTPADGADQRGRRVTVDLEAKLARTPTDVYRRDRPRVRLDDVRVWRDDPGYEAALREYCFGVLPDTTDGRHGAIYELSAVPGPRALAALHGMCDLMTDADDAYHLITVLGERGDPASLAVIERVPRRAGEKAAKSRAEERRAWELERLRLRSKHGAALAGKPFDAEQQHLYLRCLDGDAGVAALAAELDDRGHDVFLARHAEVAGYVDRPEVRAALRRVADDATRPDRARVEAHAALARLGEAGSLAYLRRSLAHPAPMARLRAAEGLWRLGHRDGVRTLVELLDARPLETGQEGLRVGEGSFTVTAVRGGTLDAVRGACRLLGEIGDVSAVAPLRRLLAENLNGVAEGGGSGTAWPGRPDAVALARLGDFSGVPVLRAAIARGDRIDVVPGRSSVGAFVQIGLRRFVPELLPLLDHRDAEKRAGAARDILVLLDRGR